MVMIWPHFNFLSTSDSAIMEEAKNNITNTKDEWKIYIFQYVKNKHYHGIDTNITLIYTHHNTKLDIYVVS